LSFELFPDRAENFWSKSGARVIGFWRSCCVSSAIILNQPSSDLFVTCASRQTNNLAQGSHEFSLAKPDARV
jgi:hypothetical protein